MVSRDGGRDWSLYQVCRGVHLTAVKFQDRDNGWVCGWGGALYKTDDGGEHWESCEHPFGAENLVSLAVVPGEKVYVAAYESGIAVATDLPEVEPEPADDHDDEHNHLHYQPPLHPHS